MYQVKTHRSAPTPPPTTGGEPKVWVRSRIRRTPGHAVVTGTPQPEQRNVLTKCAWRPKGGLVISRAEAIEMQVMPCRACFRTRD